MKFGWLTLAHSPSPEHDAQRIFEQLEQATLAEELGFDGVWLTEHNFTGESVYVDPIPFAAALAMRTQRIRIGFAVIQMALRHPVRLATQLSAARQSHAGTPRHRRRPRLAVQRVRVRRLRPQKRRRARAHGRGARRDDAGLDGNAARPQGQILHACACPSYGQRPCSGRTRRSGTAWRRPPRSASAARRACRS